VNDDWDSSMPGIDWLLFREAENARILARLRESAHRLDLDHPVVANPVGSLWTNPGGPDRYSVDNWAIAAEVDVAGVSHYPDQWERANGRAYPAPRHAFVFNHVRSAAAAAGRPFILTELQTNARSGMALHGYLDYDDLHVASWLAFSSNCKGILYWKWLPFFRGRQAFGRGLCDATGELADRGRAVRDVGRVLERDGTLLYEAEPLPARAAILLDQVGLYKSLEAGQSRSPRFFMKESYEGTFQALWSAHVPVDVLRMDRPLAAADLEPYRIVYLPFQMAVPPEVAALLASWVRGGGWLVADARTAIMDDRDFGDDTSPGGGLDAVFGVTRLDQVASEEGSTVAVDGPAALGLDPPVAGSFTGAYFRERWRLGPGAEVVATFPDDGEPAIVMRREGAGQAVLSAVPLGGSHYHDPAGLAGPIVAGLAARAGARSPVVLDAGGRGAQVGLQVHRHPDGGLIVYLVNTGEEPVSGVVRVPASLVRRVDRVRELVEDVETSLQAGDGDLDLEVSLPAKRARVFLLAPADDAP
jgi:beta-galactosidase